MHRRQQKSRAIAIDGSREAGIIARNPRESVAIAVAAGATVWILVNALFMQAGPHPAPLFSTRQGAAILAPPPAASAATPAATSAAAGAMRLPPPLPAALTQANGAAAPTRNDPIAALIAPSRQLMAVQRALSDFGYGQIQPDGLYGPETKDAIVRFERQHKLPVTGQVSDRLLKALATMTGVSFN